MPAKGFTPSCDDRDPNIIAHRPACHKKPPTRVEPHASSEEDRAFDDSRVEDGLEELDGLRNSRDREARRE